MATKLSDIDEDDEACCLGEAEKNEVAVYMALVNGGDRALPDICRRRQGEMHDSLRPEIILLGAARGGGLLSMHYSLKYLEAELRAGLPAHLCVDEEEWGMTALELAAKGGHVDVVQYLLRHGALEMESDIVAEGREREENENSNKLVTAELGISRHNTSRFTPLHLAAVEAPMLTRTLSLTPTLSP